MPRPILRARASVELESPRVSGALLTAYRSISPLYLRLAFKIRSIRLLRASVAVEAARDFQEGRSRLIFAFRHPYGHEPQVVAAAIARAVPAAARSAGRPLPRPLHAHFIHGHEVALWSGALVRWVLPRAGALPIHHVKMDAGGMERIRTHLRDGAFPLALAPEGQVSYSSSTVPRLERGFASLAFRCAEDLEAAGRPERVTVLPLSVHMRYGAGAERVLEGSIARLERECGIAGRSGEGPHERLRAVAAALVAHAEEFYAGLDRIPRAEGAGSLNGRWAAVLEAALTVGEGALGLPSDGDLTRRVYRIRQAGWDRIYRDDLGSGERGTARSPLFRALADRAAGEAWFAMRHMELADIGAYLDFDSLTDHEPLDLLLERAVNYLDLTSRLRGGNITDRLTPARSDAVIVAGRPLELRDRLADYRGGRKTALDAATEDLEARYLDCVDLFRKEYADGER